MRLLYVQGMETVQSRILAYALLDTLILYVLLHVVALVLYSMNLPFVLFMVFVKQMTHANVIHILVETIVSTHTVMVY